MAIIITDECINCGACEPECPNTAIYEAGAEWKIGDGTGVKGTYQVETGGEVAVNSIQKPVYDEVYYVVTDK